jgi:hypothetical protein
VASNAAESRGAAQFRMAFVLPKRFAEQTAAPPEPTNEQVEVARVHWGTVAVTTFSGWCSASDVVALEADFVQVRLQRGFRSSRGLNALTLTDG